MRRIASVACLLLFASFAATADPEPPKPTVTLEQPVTLELPPTVTVEVGKRCVITAQTSAKKVTWHTPAGVDALPLDGKRLAVWAAPGTYVLRAMAPSGDDVISTEVVLTVTGARPPPIPPGPTPIPPDPVPVPPDPNAALVAKFQNALAADIAAGQGTKEKAAALAVVFESGAGLLALNDPAIAPKTVGELTTKMINASVAKGVPRLPYLKNVRAVVEANTPLLNGMTELTPGLKAEFQTKYRAVAAALAEASK